MSDNQNDEGIFGRNKKQSGQTALAKAVQQDNKALQLQHQAVGKLAALVASGQTVTADAQRLLLFLASYGTGSQMGRAVFSSGELCGLPAAKKAAGQSKVMAKDPDMRPDDPLNVERERLVDEWTMVPASPPSDDGVQLGLDGPRLTSAVKILVGREWAKTTDDGEFGIRCDFHEVSLTDAGRAAAQGAVKKAGLKAGANFDDFSGLPGLFDEEVSAGGGSNATEREQFTAMLSRARVGYGAGPVREESPYAGENRTSIVIDHGKAAVDFTFDNDGKLAGVGFMIGKSWGGYRDEIKEGGEPGAKAAETPAEPDEVTQPSAKGRRNDTSGG